MPYCQKCGRELHESSQYCHYCGINLGGNNTSYTPFHGNGRNISDGDYIAFVGNNADKYIANFKKFKIAGIENFTPTWHWPAFFVGFWWMLYRKMYLWALAAFIVACIPYLGFVGMIAWGVTGNYIYYKHVSSKIKALRDINPHGDLSTTLSQIGGVNKWVVVVAVVLTIIAMIIFLMSIILSMFFLGSKETFYM
ncbi:MAG: hypothetical protein N2738_02005 [Thermodesulfovibrionales bacterium]|nr:hypothetical protein [Thermodesulfovibrionales bacterium]